MRLPEPERFIICLAACLLGIGVVMIYSSDQPSSLGIKGSGLAGGVLLRHLTALVLGLGVMVGLMWLDYRRLEPLCYVVLGLGLLGLVMVLIPDIGSLQNGARRWIRFPFSGGTLGFQPSELAKLAMVIFLASWASRNHPRMHEFLRGFLFPLLAVLTFTSLVVLEPDFGTGAFLAVLGLMVMVVAGTRWVYAVLSLLGSLPVLYFLIHQAAYRKERVLAFLDPWGDTSRAGYHIVQSWISLGSGGPFGKGLGEGHQKLFFLPECSGDFVFATIGEELGFLGTMSVVVLFGLLVWQGLRVALRAKEPFGRILALGITFMLGYQAAFNIAVVVGCVPIKGIPLPFISAGGSSLFLSLAALGILLSIARHSRDAEPLLAWRPGLKKYWLRLDPMNLPAGRVRRTVH